MGLGQCAFEVSRRDERCVEFCYDLLLLGTLD